MEYESYFIKDFMRRTLKIVRDYEGPYDATLLVNCLLGLLIVSKESLIASIPDTPFEDLAVWGIKRTSIKKFGKCEYGHEHKPNLRQLVRRLRNAVAHFNVDPIHKNTEVIGFQFSDRSGFMAEITLEEVHAFVTKLASHLETEA